MKPRRPLLLISLLLLASRLDTSAGPEALTKEKPLMIKVTSAAFNEGEAIPQKFTCDGSNTSPALSWSNVPSDAKNVALICEDPDAPGGTFTHWVLYGLPGTVNQLPEGLPTEATLEIGAKQGMNDFGNTGYGGPCPPKGHKVHRYFFRVYALDAVMLLSPRATKEDLLSAMRGHILAEGALMGTCQR